MASERAIELRAGDYRLVLTPDRGGSIARFDWRGEPLMRATCGPSVLDTACFPLVPFSNRIAFGAFTAGGREIRLAPNFPDSDHPHTLHGFGWLSAWKVVSARSADAVLRHDHVADAWPWAYRAEQTFLLDPSGLTHALRVTNNGETPMPAGLGLHPYFPRTERTTYRGLHRGEWTTSADRLPVRLTEADEPLDWWHGRPVGARSVDTAYTARTGALTITWPERDLQLNIEPSPDLSHTVVYSPVGADHFCVEPVNHAPDALNSTHPGQMPWLQVGETMQVHVRYSMTT